MSVYDEPAARTSKRVTYVRENMTPDRYERLVEFLDDRAGDYLRSVIQYDESDWQILYLRQTFSREYVEDAMPDVHDALSNRDAIVEQDIYTPLGEAEGAIELHENAALIQIHESEVEGVIITLDRGAGRNLASFVEQCRYILESPLAS